MPLPRSFLAMLPLVLGACSGITPNPYIGEVSPPESYTDRDIVFIIRGSGFVPTTDLDPARGTRELRMDGFKGRVFRGKRSAMLTNFEWHSTTEIAATLTAANSLDLGVGIYCMEITDSRGQTASWGGPDPDTCQILLHGRDPVAPELIIESPEEQSDYILGSSIPLVAVANDSRVGTTGQFPGSMDRIDWSLELIGKGPEYPAQEGQCQAPPGATEMRCEVNIDIPVDWPAQSLAILKVTAIDASESPKSTSQTRIIRLFPVPWTLSVIPQWGGESGGTEVLVKGGFFVHGTRILLNGKPLIPDGGVRLENGNITGRTPANPIGKATLTIATPSGEFHFPEVFEYRMKPVIRGISPSQGPRGTQIKVFAEGITHQTTVRIGPSLQSALPLLSSSQPSDNIITGRIPNGTGTQIVWILDPDLGFSFIDDGFTYTTP